MEKENKIMTLLEEPSFELSKTSIAQVCNDIIMSSEDQDVIHQLVHCDFILNVFKQSSVALRKTALDELDKYPNNECIYMGVKLRQKETGVKYDYSNNDLWVQKNEKLNKLKKEIKDLENTLRTITTKRSVLDEETGEIFEFVPPIKTSTTSVEVTFPKDADIINQLKK